MQMQLLTAALSRLPEFQQLLTALEGGRCPAALSGVAAIHRAHIAAGLALKTGRPVVVVCADESEGERMARDLTALSGKPVPMLTPRSFTFHNAATVSRQWEQRRLAMLRGLSTGELTLVVATVGGLMQRTMEPEVLECCCVTLEVGKSHDLNDLAETLTAAGYTRCDQVEGPGQFALRGGILDVFSPGMDRPVRAEFFGDEVDAMGVFDPDSQRRTENLDRAVLLPAAETLPQMAPGGRAGLAVKLGKLAAKALQKGEKELSATLEQDREAIAQGRSFPAMDRYLPLIYPKLCTAADFLPGDACVVFSECARVAERAKTYQWQLEEDAKTLMKLGWMISFTGSITFKNARRALEVIDLLPLDRMMIETDSPYMSPEPFRGRRNDSGRVHLVAEAIARRKGLDPEEVARITLGNGRRFFRI